MKILFLTKYYPPSKGGIERYGQLLCTTLVQRGVDVEVVAVVEGDQTARTESVEGVTVHRFGAQAAVSNSPIALGLLSRIRQLVDRCDLVHLNFPNPWMDMLYLLFGRGKKAVLTYHADIVRPGGSLAGWLLKGYQPWIRSLLRRVDAIIATSPHNAENSPFLRDHEGRCEVIPLPVDTDVLSNEDPETVRRAQDRYGKYALFVGRLVPYKGVAYLLEAFTRIPGIRLVIVGRGPLEEELQRRASDLGIGNQVFFLGGVADEELWALYRGCQCFVLPSISEAAAFGMVQTEAMACSRPAICTDVGTGTTYVNPDGVTGLVVPPRDPAALAEKIGTLVTDPSLQDELGRNGRARVEELFAKEAVVDRTLKLYREILTEG